MKHRAYFEIDPRAKVAVDENGEGAAAYVALTIDSAEDQIDPYRIMENVNKHIGIAYPLTWFRLISKEEFEANSWSGEDDDV